MTMTIEFRVATHADIPWLVDLVTRAYRGDASRKGWTTEADLLDGQRIDAERVEALIDAPQSVVVIARVNGNDIACAHVALEDGAGYFGMFSVEPETQGGGIGKAVLAEAERIAHSRWQAEVMRMTVIDVRDTLIAFYERRGYVRTGRYAPFPYGDERCGIPKRDDLRFEVLEKDLRHG
ncbi:GNAT family N-acetyltransferase [Lysobacter sp. HDW10]|uniref:GNAT family N-acetyltransferase n=1 Tax=Lysobacter sp. HDW10 TaxID=2714936 RepID=UPI00140A9736|nr:GNAT family N-acetyltransferase [Lysobacter sp. HDW10]QIK80262.1 GNAT family N-acetyltransferase [Lysobacter sp. HDW10]